MCSFCAALQQASQWEVNRWLLPSNSIIQQTPILSAFLPHLLCEIVQQSWSLVLWWFGKTRNGTCCSDKPMTERLRYPNWKPPAVPICSLSLYMEVWKCDVEMELVPESKNFWNTFGFLHFASCSQKSLNTFLKTLWSMDGIWVCFVYNLNTHFSCRI